MSKIVKCPVCKGRGKSSDDLLKCKPCGGYGEVCAKTETEARKTMKGLSFSGLAREGYEPTVF